MYAIRLKTIREMKQYHERKIYTKSFFIEGENIYIYSIPLYIFLIAHNKGFSEKCSPFLTEKVTQNLCPCDKHTVKSDSNAFYRQ